MSTYTQHKGLEKPLSTEKYNVAVANKNSDVIDSEFHKLDLKNQSQDELLATKEALNAEISRATAKENEIANSLNAEITRAASAEDNISDNLTNEINRATASETGLSNSLSAHISDKANPHNVSKSQIGLGNVENKSSATIRSELTKSNVTNALGYTPYTPNEVDNKLSALETNIDWKESVAAFDDIATTYPEPQDGWTVNVNDTDYTYRYNGTSWIPISANAIPKATDSMDGLLSMEDHAKYEDANSKKHAHSNKSVLDGITSALITAWNNAVEHIADSVKHITAEERTKWNAAKTHADSAHAPSNAERNVIVTVKKNGDIVAPDDSRAINITIPTKISELINDCGFKTTDDEDEDIHTMSGNIDMEEHKIVGGINGRKEIDFEGETLEIGVRKASGDWLSKLRFNENTGNIEITLSDLLRIMHRSGREVFYISDDNIYLKNEYIYLLGKNNTRIEVGYGNGVDIITPNGKSIIRAKEIEFSAAPDYKMYMYKAKEIRLVPGAEKRTDPPKESCYVKSGNIQGVLLANGNKPSISNFGRIGAELVDAGDMYGTLHGDVYCDYEYEDIQPDGILKTYGYSQFETGDRSSFHFYNHVEKKYDEGGTTEVWSDRDMYYFLNQYAFHPAAFAGGQPDLGYGGGASYRWNNIYATNGTIQTSDRNEKNTIEDLTSEQALSLLMGLATKTYKMNAGTSGRTHWGLISQDIEELMDSLGMDSTDFGGFIKSPKTIMVEEEEEYEDADENGETITKTRKVQKEQVIEGEYVYSLRYDEFIAPIVKVVQMQQSEIEDLKNTVQSQQTEINELKQAINELKEMIKNGN